MERITEILHEGLTNTLRVHVPAPSPIIDRIARDASNNIAMALASEIGETLDEAHLQQIEHESLRTKLHNAGGHGATLDVMLTAVLERARLSLAARDAAQQLVDAASELLEAFDEGDVDVFHPDDDDPVLPNATIECPEDDTCKCRGPAALNELSRACATARRELPHVERVQ
ncbi:MAG TPA: hypothetical protein VMZ53_03625 [Kofleriaceae bacterium]|nr:hypothetical protein [Kofleriaceae bacterium]